jgi:phage protein D
MHPIVEVTVDGRPVAGAFYERLVSLTVTDKEGISSDAFSAELNDGPPSFLALPRTGAIVQIRLGYREGGVASVGDFEVDKVQAKCLPYSLDISGKAAPLRTGKLKENQERHWDDKTVKDIVEELAGESGLEAAVDAEVGAHKYKWVAQEDESNIHFIERLARRHGAIFAVKNGRLIFGKRGSGNTTSGGFTGTVFVTPPIIIQGSCTFEANDRTKYGKVVAYHQDRDKAERVEVEVEIETDSDSVYRLSEPFADIAEADKAAQAKADQLKRGEGSASVTVIGDTSIIAGAPLVFQGVRPGLDGVPYIIDTVTHEYSKSSGFLTKIDAKLYDGKSSKGSGGGSDGAAGNQQGGQTVQQSTVAPDSPSGTPGTPAHWMQGRVSGITDEN